MPDIAACLKRNLEESIEAKRRLLADNAFSGLFCEAVDKIIERYVQGGRIYIAGNGGSAADAQHLAAEFVSKLAQDRAPLPAEALTTDSSILTAIGNDYGYDEIFARQVLGKMREKDVFLGITTSGNSSNIIRALEACRKHNILSITFCGRDGGKVKDLTDFCLIVPGEKTSTIQELHIVLAHTLCESVETAMLSKGMI